jgi:hypothetical protein
MRTGIFVVCGTYIIIYVVHESLTRRAHVDKDPWHRVTRVRTYYVIQVRLRLQQRRRDVFKKVFLLLFSRSRLPLSFEYILKKFIFKYHTCVHTSRVFTLYSRAENMVSRPATHGRP